MKLVLVWGLTMSMPKTKLLVAGTPFCEEEDLQPIDEATCSQYTIL